MKIHFYLKSGQTITVPKVSECTWKTSTETGDFRSYELDLEKGNRIRPLFINPLQIAAIVRED